MLACLPSAVSSMFLNNIRFASNGISLISHLLTHTNPSYSEKILLSISDITRLDIELGDIIIDYMARVRGISKRIQGVSMENIIPLFDILSLDHDSYPRVKICYLAGNPMLVN